MRDVTVAEVAKTFGNVVAELAKSFGDWVLAESLGDFRYGFDGVPYGWG